MERSDPDLPRGMLRIAKRGNPLDSSPAEASSGEVSGQTRGGDSSNEPDTSQPRRGVLRINTSDLGNISARPGHARPIRLPMPMDRSFSPRGGRPEFGNPRLAPSPRARPMVPVSVSPVRSPVLSRSEVAMSELPRPVKIATNVLRPAVPSISSPVVKGLSVPEGRPPGPVFASDFATQEIFRALEQAKPTTIPKPPGLELSDEQKTDPVALRDYYLTQLRMLANDSQLLRDFTMPKPVKLIDSYFFWCLRKGPQLEQLIQAVNPKNQNFQVVGVLGFQETGKSYILSQLIGPKDGGLAFCPSPTSVDLDKPYGKFRTEGIDCYISREQRTIYLDVQPVYSASVLEEMITGDRKPPAVSSEHVFVEHTVELQSIMFGAFIMSVCHKIVIVMKSCIDERLLRFLRLATILKLGPVHKDALNEANLFDHWPELIFVNNMCNIQDLYFERVHLARERLTTLMKDYPLFYNGEPGKSEGKFASLFLIPDAESFGRDQYAKAEFRNQLTLLKSVVVGNVAKGSVTPGMAMTEKEWFKFARRCWAAVCKAPLVNSIAKELNVSNST